MAQKTNTELKVFLDSATDSYDKYVNLADKSGTVFFDRNRRAVYTEGVLITSDVVDVKMDGSKLLVKKVGDSAYTELADLAIPDAFVRFDATQKLTDTQKSQARTNIGAEAADDTILKEEDVVNNLTTDNAKAPLSAAQGKVLNENKVDKIDGKGLSTNDYTNDDKNKLDGIEEGAQVNFIIQANQSQVKPSNIANTIAISGNLVDSTNAATGSVKFNLSHKYVAADKKIYFFNSANAPTTGTDGNIFFIDTTDFVKDGILSNAEYNEITHILTLTFNSDAGKEPIPIDLSDLVNVYKASNGITLDGDTFKLALGDGVKVEDGSLTLSLGNGLAFDDSGKLVVDFASNGVTSINGMGGGAYTINDERVSVGTAGNILSPISVVNDSAAKKLKIKANPKHIFAQFFHENNEDATSGIRAKGVSITENENGNPYSMLMDFTPKVWSF